MRRVERSRSFGGWQEVWAHRSDVLGCEMRVGVYLPPREGPRPVLYWLSGLTCTEQNFVTKAGAQRLAAEHGLIVVAPDTSPRGEGVADDPAWDLGQGAGFYVNATRAPWSAHYRMYDYVVKELPALIRATFPTTAAAGISGHSMGGHGALIAALREPGAYRSVSAFAPIASASTCPWGEKALAAYLGDDRDGWRAWDAAAVVASARERLPLLIDQGDADSFLATQLFPERLARACEAAGHPLTLRMQPGYDHSYHFVSTFLPDHFAWHAGHLGD